MTDKQDPKISTPESDPAKPPPEAKPPRKRGSLRAKVRWTKRIIIVALIILLILLLLNWKYCRKGKGDGGLKEADGTRTKGVPAQMTAQSARKAAPLACRLRVDSKGIFHRDKVVTIADAVKACKGAKRAELKVTGDATFGTVKKLGEALKAAGITTVRR